MNNSQELNRPTTARGGATRPGGTSPRGEVRQPGGRACVWPTQERGRVLPPLPHLARNRPIRIQKLERVRNRSTSQRQ